MTLEDISQELWTQKASQYLSSLVQTSNLRNIVQRIFELNVSLLLGEHHKLPS